MGTTSAEALGSFAQSRAMVLRKSTYSGVCTVSAGAEPCALGAHDIVACALGCRQQALGALGLLGAALLDAAHEEGLRVVLGVLVGIDDLHVVAMALAFLRLAISASL